MSICLLFFAGLSLGWALYAIISHAHNQRAIRAHDEYMRAWILKLREPLP